MSRFVDTMVATAASANDRGMTTGEPTAPTRRTWADVHEKARRMAGALVAGGVARGDSVAVLAGDPASIAPAVQAVWLSGGSITMLHQPTPRTDLAEWAADTLRVLAMIGAELVLLGNPFDALSAVLDENGVSYRKLDELDGDPLPAPVEVDESATALLQLTSGSTADPKAVRITHGNLWSNAKAMEEAAKLDPETDRMVSWLPLFHDMGMVGFLTVPMLFGIDLVKVTPVDFLARPTLWPDLISRYQGTITAAPNFAYAIAARRMGGVEDGTWDLSRLRIALNGAEPIDPTAVKAFTDAGARFGMPAECVLCAYGMAETTLGVAFAPVFTGMAVDHVDPDELEAGRRAVPVEPGPGARSFPLLGPPLPGLEIQVVDESGAVRGEREVGQLRVRGEAVTPGYLTVDGPRDTQDADGWLDTGDEGYVVDGQVVVCGRRKDVIIMGGRNIYPTDIERAATSVEGVRAGNAVAVRLDAGSRRERFAVVVESKLAGEDDAVKELTKQISARVVDAVGLRPFTVVVLKPGSLPKTPSGKLRRSAATALVPA
ncbi:fatty acyl-AMP ligase [Saccharothrix variisporea]|uniref:Fatty-acyl-CoA synthase n=1 Tax=Saccharothrix variisporea TaxID=543527 RepID=A0A495XA05_9PSEU|nr:fatty acyl-AMP ligase [Saccharothrix variisporea]RKT70797.1 fatty-acyl-CoA synthase [Saccharothrix variisporea]